MSSERPVDAVRARIAELIGFRSTADAVTTQALARETCDGYVRTLLRFDVASEPVEAFLFEPADTPSSGGVLALHQHNSQWAIGKSEIAGLTGDPLQRSARLWRRRV